MTNRQKAILARVRPWLSEVYATAAQELGASPVGYQMNVSIPRRFEVRAGSSYQPQPMLDHVEVLKDTDGYRFRVAGSYYRKGLTAPKFRKLLPEQAHR